MSHTWLAAFFLAPGFPIGASRPLVPARHVPTRRRPAWPLTAGDRRSGKVAAGLGTAEREFCVGQLQPGRERRDLCGKGAAIVRNRALARRASVSRVRGTATDATTTHDLQFGTKRATSRSPAVFKILRESNKQTPSATCWGSPLVPGGIASARCSNTFTARTIVGGCSGRSATPQIRCLSCAQISTLEHGEYNACPNGSSVTTLLAATAYRFTRDRWNHREVQYLVFRSEFAARRNRDSVSVLAGRITAGSRHVGLWHLCRQARSDDHAIFCKLRRSRSCAAGPSHHWRMWEASPIDISAERMIVNKRP